MIKKFGIYILVGKIMNLFKKFPELYKLFENYVDKRSDVIRLAVTDKSCDYLDTKVMVAYSRTAARKDSGEPSEDDVKLEKIWDKA